MKTFGAKFVRSGPTTHAAIIEKDSDGAVLHVHERPAYVMTEAILTAVWLNERAQGYPKKDNLDHLYNGRG